MPAKHRAWKTTERPAKDLGTPELQFKRSLAAHNPVMSTRPIDILLARKDISPDAHAAAVEFAGLRKTVFGKATIQAVDLSSSAKHADGHDDPLAELKYRAACDAMKAHSFAAFNAVENLVVHEIAPVWMRHNITSSRERSDLAAGLKALVGWLHGRGKLAA